MPPLLAVLAALLAAPTLAQDLPASSTKPAPTAPAPSPPSSTPPSSAPPGAPKAAEAATPAAAASKPAVPRFARTPVGDCGCALYAPSGLVFGPPEPSPDGSRVWTGEVAVDGWSFGAVVVRFAEPLDAGGEVAPQALEELLVSYMDFLKAQLSITGAVGVGRGHVHSENADARGVIDYWQDKDGDTWAVKGWVDRERLAVLFLYGPGSYPYFTAQQMYLDGFRFK